MNMFRFISIACMFPISSALTFNAYAAVVWPVEVGQTWTYLRTDNNGQSWGVDLSFYGTQIGIDGELYYSYTNYNYTNSGDTKYNAIRSTEDAVYFINDGGDPAFRLYESVGATWMMGVDLVERMPNESVHVPYFGQNGSGNDIYMDAYVFRMEDTVENSPYWYEYFVPGIGLVGEVDYWSDVPPTVLQLASVTTVPLPPAIWLFGAGVLGLTGVARCKKAD